MTSRRSRSCPDDGFTLLEVVVALALVVSVAAGIADLFLISVRTSRAARDQTTASLLASQKIEALRTAGAVLSSGGSLTSDDAGFVDFADANGHPIGVAPDPSLLAVYVRRWHVAPLGPFPAAASVVEVRVLPVADAVRRASSDPGSHDIAEAVLVTLAGSR